MVKAVNQDAAFKKEHSLGAVNSINWARIAAQVVYYFWSYVKSGEKEIDVVVPTGNFGNIYAARVARQMGVPIRRLVLATNTNDVLHEFFQTGVYAPRENTVTTTSPSMDITDASNFERYVLQLFGGDTAKVAKLWGRLK